MLYGKFILVRFSKDVVISNIDKILVFRYILFIKLVGIVLKNIIVPRIDIRLFILVLILVDSNINIFCCLLALYLIFLGFIMSDSSIFDKILVNIINKAILWLKIAFRYV